MIAIISAVGKNYEIGYKGGLIWQIKEDLEMFKELTIGNIIIMGKKTYDSLGEPLKDRLNVVISKSMKKRDDILIYKSVEDAIESVKKFNKDIFIIGGNKIYKEALDKNLCDNLFLTKIDKEYKDADTFFPYKSLSGDWSIAKSKNLNNHVTMLEYRKFN
jgi:dihydrofolate reductase